MDPKLTGWKLFVMLFNYEIEVILVTRTGFFPFYVFLSAFVAVVLSKRSLLVVNDDALVKDRPSSFSLLPHCGQVPVTSAQSGPFCWPRPDRQPLPLGPIGGFSLISL